jgi:hypothetical protein
MPPDVGVAVAVVLEVEAAEPRMDVGATSGLEAIDVLVYVESQVGTVIGIVSRLNSPVDTGAP